MRMLEDIKKKVIRLIYTRYEATKRYNKELQILMRRKIIKLRMKARGLSVIGHEKTFKMLENTSKVLVVDTDNKKCDYREWQLL